MRKSRHARITGRSPASPYLYTPILHHQRSALGGGGQPDLFTLQSTNQNSSPYRSLQYHSVRNLRTPTDGNRENGTDPYSTTQSETYVPPQMGIGKMAHPCLFLTCLWVGVMGGEPSPSIVPRLYRTPNLAVPLYLASPNGSHTVRNREGKGEAEVGTQTWHTTHSSATSSP